MDAHLDADRMALIRSALGGLCANPAVLKAAWEDKQAGRSPSMGAFIGTAAVEAADHVLNQLDKAEADVLKSAQPKEDR